MPRGIELRPANPGQQCFLDALLDPEISLITCYGQAGNRQDAHGGGGGLVPDRPAHLQRHDGEPPGGGDGRHAGLPAGTLNEKMHPWLQSIYDAFEVLLPLNPPKTKRTPSHPRSQKTAAVTSAPQPAQTVPGAPNGQHPIVKPYEQLMARGLLKSKHSAISAAFDSGPLLRPGRGPALTPLEAKTVVTRMSKGSKLVMVGDPPRSTIRTWDSRSNGLVYPQSACAASASQRISPSRRANAVRSPRWVRARCSFPAAGCLRASRPLFPLRRGRVLPGELERVEL